jgi:hypothetical protein
LVLISTGEILIKRFTAFLCLILLSFSLGMNCNMKREHVDKIQVLVLLGEWFGDTYFPLEEKINSIGWVMKRVGVDTTYRGCYNKARDVLLTTDIFIQDLKDFKEYDCLIIPSGPQFRKFIEDETVLQFIRDAHETDLLIASFCTGNLVLDASGITSREEREYLFPDTVTVVKEGIIMGPRGGGPPPGSGFKSVPVDEILQMIAETLGVSLSV